LQLWGTQIFPYFFATDVDGDGVISAEELARFFKDDPDPIARAQAVLDKFDTNHDGVLQEDEYQVFLASLVESKPKDVGLFGYPIKDKSYVEQLALVSKNNPLRKKASALIDAAKKVAGALPKDMAGCGYVVMDHALNEILCSHDPSGKMFIGLARGKVAALTSGMTLRRQYDCPRTDHDLVGGFEMR
jgi:hypothetical protein